MARITMFLVAVSFLGAEAFGEPLRDSPAPHVIEEAPIIRAKAPAKSAQPVKSSNSLVPAIPPGPDFNLRSAQPSLIVETANPGAPSADPSFVLPPPAIQTQPLEEAPNMRTSTTGLATVLGAALLAATSNENSLRAAEPTPADVKEQFEKLKNAVDRLSNIEQKLSDQESRGVIALQKVRDDLAQAKEQIRQLQQDVAFLRDQLKKEPYVTKRIDTTTPKNAQVRLINEFVNEVSVVVNGTAYRVLPGQQTILTVPAGTLTYQVLGVQPFLQSRTLAADEVKDIRIHNPRP